VSNALEPSEDGVIRPVAHHLVAPHIAAIAWILSLEGDGADEYDTADSLREYHRIHLNQDTDLLCVVTLELRACGVINPYRMSQYLDLVRPEPLINLPEERK